MLPAAFRRDQQLTPIAIGAAREHADGLDVVRFVLFGDETYEVFAAAAG